MHPRRGIRVRNNPDWFPYGIAMGTDLRVRLPGRIPEKPLKGPVAIGIADGKFGKAGVVVLCCVRCCTNDQRG